MSKWGGVFMKSNSWGDVLTRPKVDLVSSRVVDSGGSVGVG